MITFLFAVGLLSTAEAKPRQAEVPPAPSTSATTDREAATMEVIKGKTEVDRYREAFRVMNRTSATTDELVAAVTTFADLMVNGEDARLRGNARTCFNETVDKLTKKDASRTVAVLRDVWKSSGQAEMFLDVLVTIDDQLTAEANVPQPTMIANASKGVPDANCEARTALLADLVMLAPEVGEAEDLNARRGKLASHLTTCDPSPENLGKAVKLYVDMGSGKDVETTAKSAAQAYLNRFQAEGKLDDFALVLSYWRNAGIDPATKGDVLEPIGSALLERERFDAAYVVFNAFDAERASAIQPLTTNGTK